MARRKMKVVPVSLDEITVEQIDVLGPRSAVIREIVGQYIAERVSRVLASTAPPSPEQSNG